LTFELAFGIFSISGFSVWARYSSSFYFKIISSSFLTLIYNIPIGSAALICNFNFHILNSFTSLYFNLFGRVLNVTLFFNSLTF